MFTSFQRLKRSKNKIAKKTDKHEENMESYFVRALSKLGVNKSIERVNLESIDQKSLDVHASNIDTPRTYSNPMNSFDEPCEGLFIISKGSCEIRNRKDNYSVGYLFKGNYFGESEILKIIDASYFGDIYASNNQDLEILFLPYEAMKRIRFELLPIRDQLKQRFKEQTFTLATRYKVDENLIRKF